jgi:hypothetical protein
MDRFTAKLDCKLITKIGTRGLELFAVGGRNLSLITGLNLGVSYTSSGVAITIKLRRGRMQLYLPVTLSTRFDPWAVLVGAVVQCVVNAAVTGVVRPFERMRVQRELRTVEETSGKAQASRRHDAAAQVRLMLVSATRKRAVEEASDGLVILAARYGLDVNKPGDPEW